MNIQSFQNKALLLGAFPPEHRSKEGRDYLRSIGWDDTAYRTAKRLSNTEWAGTHRKFHEMGFVGIDGEGYTDKETNKHYYFLLANSNGDWISDAEGLNSFDIFEFLFESDTGKDVMVIYGGSYDFNLWLKDLPIENIRELQAKNKTNYFPFQIECIPRKYFTLRLLGKNGKTIKSVTIWDVIGYFQMKFTKAIKQYLNVDEEEYEYIAIHKDGRSFFELGQFDEILAYCQLELKYLVRIMDKFKQLVVDLGFILRRYDGAGSLASAIHSKMQTKNYLNRSLDIEATQYAFSGGRIEPIRTGHYKGPIYKYDIRSAYPSAIARLPDISKAEWEETNGLNPFGIYAVAYEGSNLALAHPLFHREKDHIFFPSKTIGWHYGTEILPIDDDKYEILNGFVPMGEGKERPFAWVEDYYYQRLDLKQSGDAGEKVIKLGLNSLYGKFAQQVGWRIEGGKVKPPAYHQLYFAGWITAYTRGLIWEAIKNDLDAIIGIETDGIFSTRPLNVKLGTGLGEWELEEYDEIVYVQNGLYWLGLNGEWVVKTRGMDSGQLELDDLLQAYSDLRLGTKPIAIGETTKFITYGTAVQRDIWPLWNQWVKETKEVTLIPTGKRRIPLNLQIEDYARCRNELVESLPAIPSLIVSGKYGIPWIDGQTKEDIDSVEIV